MVYLNKTFLIAVGVSAVLHGAVLLQNPSFTVSDKDEIKKEVQISYIKKPSEPIMELKKDDLSSLFKIPQKITLNKTEIPLLKNKESIAKQEELKKTVSNRTDTLNKPVLAKPDIISIKKKITLPPMDNKISDPSYINYYQLNRERIKRSAYQNYTGKEEGEVTMSFVVAEDGSLKELRLIEDGSSRSTYLREIALQSVQDASPFPAFPKELNYPELSFKVTIIFEIE